MTPLFMHWSYYSIALDHWFEDEIKMLILLWWSAVSIANEMNSGIFPNDLIVYTKAA